MLVLTGQVKYLFTCWLNDKKKTQNKKNTRSKILHFLTDVDIIYVQGREMEYQ